MNNGCETKPTARFVPAKQASSMLSLNLLTVLYNCQGRFKRLALKSLKYDGFFLEGSTMTGEEHLSFLLFC